MVGLYFSFLLALLLALEKICRVVSLSTNELTISVDENTPVSTKVVSLRTKLKLTDPNVTFLPISTEYFLLSKSGDITIQKPIDRDQDPKLCGDTGYVDVCSTTHVVWLSNSNIITVRIVINDLNDNKPFWADKQPTISVAENSPINLEIDLPLAIDRDTNVNGIEKYKLLTGSRMGKFELLNRQSPNGVIPKLVIKKTLDREEFDHFNLTLAAIDGSPPYHTGYTTLVVWIADQNDNSPVFQKVTYRVKIKEDFPINQMLPLHPKATDRDSGKFGEVSYQFSIATPENVKKIFKINKENGRIMVVGKIDYDNGKQLYEFVLVASDNGTPSLSATAKIIIEIEDVNDQAPLISLNYLNGDGGSDSGGDGSEKLLVQENLPVNHLVTTITVSDTDKNDGGRFNCSLLGGTSAGSSFSLEYYKSLDHIAVYQLVTVRQFDRETESVVHAQIVCTDAGTPRKTSSQLVTVTITDVNDCPPRFRKPRYKFETTEENDANTEIGQIEATDMDANDNGKIEYFVLGSEEIQNTFRVDNKGGLIALKNLDREIQSDGFKFVVMAKDCGTPFLNDSVEVEIKLIDINDCIPKFSRSEYKFAAEENDNDFQTGSVSPIILGKIEATDCDIGINAKKTFTLSEPQSLFEITPDGYFKVTGQMNREIKSFYSFPVLVVDGDPSRKHRNTATALISVTVSDKNDNPPVFLHSTNLSQPIQISYKEELGIEVFKIYASDADTGINAIIDFSIKSTNYNKDYFSVNPKSGSITLIRRLSISDVGKHKLTIVATDNGQPKLSSEVVITVLVDTSTARSQQSNSLDSSLASFLMLSNNKLIIIIVVVATVLVCIILISVICLMTGCKIGPSSRSRFHTEDNDDSTKPITGLAHSCLPPYDMGNTKFTDINESLLPPSSFYMINNQPLTNTYSHQANHGVGYPYDPYNNTVASPYGRPTPSESLEFSNGDRVNSPTRYQPPYSTLEFCRQSSPQMSVRNGILSTADTFQPQSHSMSLSRTPLHNKWSIRNENSTGYESNGYQILYKDIENNKYPAKVPCSSMTPEHCPTSN